MAARIPLNLRNKANEGRIEKSASYRSGISHPQTYRTPANDSTIEPRFDGNQPLRRYPNGVLDVAYAANKVIDIIHKIQDAGNVTDYEKALLSSILPVTIGGMSSDMAHALTKLSAAEKVVVQAAVEGHLAAEANWNAGRGGGSVPGRKIRIRS